MKIPAGKNFESMGCYGNISHLMGLNHFWTGSTLLDDDTELADVLVSGFILLLYKTPLANTSYKEIMENGYRSEIL